jgi:hypothetical protein
MLEHANRARILELAALLHPVALSDLSASELDHFRRLFDARLCAFFANIGAHERFRLHECSPDELLRLLIAIQCNGFSSGVFECVFCILCLWLPVLTCTYFVHAGLYLHLAIVNHACRPNCIKFAPTVDNPCSEIRAIAHIPAGMPVTISYLTPLEQTYARRQHILSSQFRFHCRCSRCIDAEQPQPASFIEARVCNECRRSLKANGTATDVAACTAEPALYFQPQPGALDAIVPQPSCGACGQQPSTSEMASVDAQLHDVEIEVEEAERECASARLTVARATHLVASSLAPMLQRLAALPVHPHHILVARVHRARVDALSLITSRVSGRSVAHCVALLESALCVRRAQHAYLDRDQTHCDVAKAWQDVAFALQCVRDHVEASERVAAFPELASDALLDVLLAHAQRKFATVSAHY